MPDSNRFEALRQAPLWDFALASYQTPGCEAACLTLQDDASVDVCELLFHAWLWQHGLAASSEPLALERDARTRWQENVTVRLRTLRRELKPLAAQRDSVATLRGLIAQAELHAERENLQRWEEWARHSDRSRLVAAENIAKTLCECLKRQLFQCSLGMPQTTTPSVTDSSAEAFRTLAQLLDPYQRPR